MRDRLLRVATALVVAAIGLTAGVVLFGRFDTSPQAGTFLNVVAADSWAFILVVGMLLGAGTYLAVEYRQTGRLASIERQLTTRTIVLMPLAIALNIILGTAVASTLRIPIYLDSIGTILVGVLCGPVAGALTGALGSILWSYAFPPPFQSPPAAAFAIVAAVIGLLAGLAAQLGVFRPRPERPAREIVLGAGIAVVLVAGLAGLAYSGYLAIFKATSITPTSDETLLAWLGWLALGIVAATVLGMLILLVIRRDLGVAYTVVAGMITGIVAAILSAPIAATLFGGITGSGTHFLVAIFRQAGADVQAAVLGQGLLRDPIDKVITFLTVYVILSALARRTKAGFPQGERVATTQGAEATG